MSVHDDRGSITAFVAVVATALVLVAGMAYDGGQVIAAHNAARNDAEQAARAGAQQIDLDHLRATGNPRLDPPTTTQESTRRSGRSATAADAQHSWRAHLEVTDQRLRSTTRHPASSEAHHEPRRPADPVSP